MLKRRTRGKLIGGNNMEKFELIPNKSYGIFIIGEYIEKHLHLDHVISDIEFYYSYEFTDLKINVWVENDKIETVRCDAECYFQGKNLIGMLYDDFLSLVKQEPSNKDICYVPVSRDRGQNQNVYDFDDLGLQVWVWRNKIRTILISNYEEE